MPNDSVVAAEGSFMTLAIAVAWLMAVSFASGQIPNRETSPPATSAELAVAAAALEDASGGPFFPAKRLAEAVSLIRRIHRDYPATRDIGAARSTEGATDEDQSLQFDVPHSLCEGAAKAASEQPGDVDRWLNPSHSGNARFDSITAQMGGARELHLECIGPDFAEVTVYFRKPVNIPGVARAYAGIQGIAVSPFQGFFSGSGDALHISPGKDYWTVAMLLGWGDCPSGCINNHLWKFKYRQSSGKIEMVVDSGPPVPRDRNW
jgi:hypothetical protein